MLQTRDALPQFLIAGLSGLTMLATTAVASETIAPNFTGLDGIAARCNVSTQLKFATAMCDRLVNNAAEYSAAKEIKFAYSDTLSSTNSISVPDGKGLENPLHLEFFIRGTNGNPAGASVRIVASVYFRNAVESGAASTNDLPRAGRLVMWEKAAVANGPVKRLSGALTIHMSKKLKTLVDLFAKRNSH